MTTEEEAELKRQGQLIASLEHNEAFILWRKEIADPVLEQIGMKLAQSDQLSEQVLRANVLLQYLVKDLFYGMFDRIRVANQDTNQ
jgi:hypothetical protein